MSIKSSYVEKLKNQRRDLSVALKAIMDDAQCHHSAPFHTVSSWLIDDARKVYRKIWRKP